MVMPCYGNGFVRAENSRGFYGSYDDQRAYNRRLKDAVNYSRNVKGCIKIVTAVTCSANDNTQFYCKAK